MSNEHQHPAGHPTPPVTVPAPPKEPKPDLSKVSLYSVTRNGISKILTAFAGSRGAWLNKVYQAPQIETDGEVAIEKDEKLLANLSWIGKDNVKKIINLYLKRMSQDIHDDSIPEKENLATFPEGAEEGIFHESTFLSKMATFTAAQFKLSELIEQYEEAVAAYTNSTGKEFFDAVVAAQGDPVKIAALKAGIDKLSSSVNQLKAEIEVRRNRRSKEVETETVSPE